MQEEYVQHQMGDNKRKCQSRSNGMYQQKDKLDMEIDEIWMLMMRVLREYLRGGILR
jgi:ribosomal protein L19E